VGYAFRNTYDFYHEIKDFKVYELGQRLEGLKRQIENTKVRMVQQAAADAFYAPCLIEILLRCVL
jgi:hypothetical protein